MVAVLAQLGLPALANADSRSEFEVRDSMTLPFDTNSAIVAGLFRASARRRFSSPRLLTTQPDHPAVAPPAHAPKLWHHYPVLLRILNNTANAARAEGPRRRHRAA